MPAGRVVGGRSLTTEVIPAPAFSDIWDENRGFAAEGCLFRISGFHVPMKELTFSQFFRSSVRFSDRWDSGRIPEDFQPEGGDPEGIRNSGKEFRNGC